MIRFFNNGPPPPASTPPPPSSSSSSSSSSFNGNETTNPHDAKSQITPASYHPAKWSQLQNHLSRVSPAFRHFNTNLILHLCIVGRYIVLGIGTIYFLCLLCSLTKSRSDIISLLSTHLSSRIGNPVQLRSNESYDIDNCHMTLTALRDLILRDHFFPTHLAGYALWGAGFRSHVMVHALSVSFECVEIALRGWVPNFRECWYDAWILDALVSNTAGALIGIEFGTGILKLRPFPRRDYPWGCIFLIDGALLGMLNGFLLKAVFVVPPDHSLFMWRAIFVAAFQFYMHDEFVVGGMENTPSDMSSWWGKPRLSNLPWTFVLYVVLITVEFVCIYLHQDGLFPLEALPVWSILLMQFFLVLFYVSVVFVSFGWFGFTSKVRKGTKPKSEQETQHDSHWKFKLCVQFSFMVFFWRCFCASAVFVSFPLCFGRMRKANMSQGQMESETIFKP